jgi:hypothetical protein
MLTYVIGRLLIYSTVIVGFGQILTASLKKKKKNPAKSTSQNSPEQP